MKQLFFFIPIFFLFASCNESNEQLVDRAISYKQNGQIKEAIAIYDRIIERNSKLQIPYFNRGLCYVVLNDYPKALADFNKVVSLQTIGGAVLTLNPNSPFASEEALAQVDYTETLYQRAQVLYHMDSLKSSYRDFEELVTRNYQKSNCQLWQGTLWLKGGDKQKACAKFGEARQSAFTEEDTREADKFIKDYCNK